MYIYTYSMYKPDDLINIIEIYPAILKLSFDLTKPLCFA